MNAVDDDTRLWSEALDLLLKLRENPADRAAQLAVSHWREQSGAHRAAWDDVEQVWRLSSMSGGPMSATSSPASSVGQRRMTRRRVVAGLGLAAAASIVAVAGPEIVQRARADFVTGTGEIRRADLPDGSVVTLGPDSALAVAFSAASRTVNLLTGMAYFDVMPNVDRPFRVRCRDVTAAAAGTAFEMSHDADLLTVAVDRGRVSAHWLHGGQQKQTDLGAGDWISLADNDAVVSSGRRDAEHRAAWRHGLIVAE